MGAGARTLCLSGGAVTGDPPALLQASKELVEAKFQTVEAVLASLREEVQVRVCMSVCVCARQGVCACVVSATTWPAYAREGLVGCQRASVHIATVSPLVSP